MSMKHRIAFYIYRLPVVLIIFTIILLSVSWILSAYMQYPFVRNPLCVDGIRWMIGNAKQNIENIPLSMVVFILMAISVVKESGFLARLFTVKHSFSLKQRRAMYVVLITTVLYVLTIALISMMSRGILYGTFGDFYNSPMYKGWILLLLFLFYIQGNLYGCMSGRFASFMDVAEAHAKLLVNVRHYFLTAICGSIFMCTIEYTRVLSVFDNYEILIAVLHFVIYYVLLLMHVLFQSPQ